MTYTTGPGSGPQNRGFWRRHRILRAFVIVVAVIAVAAIVGNVYHAVTHTGAYAPKSSSANGNSASGNSGGGSTAPATGPTTYYVTSDGNVAVETNAAGSSGTNLILPDGLGDGGTLTVPATSQAAYNTVKYDGGERACYVDFPNSGTPPVQWAVWINPNGTAQDGTIARLYCQQIENDPGANYISGAVTPGG